MNTSSLPSCLFYKSNPVLIDAFQQNPTVASKSQTFSVVNTDKLNGSTEYVPGVSIQSNSIKEVDAPRLSRPNAQVEVMDQSSSATCTTIPQANFTLHATSWAG